MMVRFQVFSNFRILLEYLLHPEVCCPVLVVGYIICVALDSYMSNILTVEGIFAVSESSLICSGCGTISGLGRS